SGRRIYFDAHNVHQVPKGHINDIIISFKILIFSKTAPARFADASAGTLPKAGMERLDQLKF
ncbi:MAG: hypothetical protein PHN75_10985, partial [Syntrophales bacterium]|nr:hypothetical protein [Syntrophales bacterium]